MRKLAFLLSVFLAAPAMGAETCDYVSEGGAVLDTSKPGEVTVDDSDACQLFGNGTGIAVMRAQCGDIDYAFFSASSDLGGAHNLIIFMNTVWYARCSETVE